jgi:hypothetical protein
MRYEINEKYKRQLTLKQRLFKKSLLKQFLLPYSSQLRQSTSNMDAEASLFGFLNPLTATYVKFDFHRG